MKLSTRFKLSSTPAWIAVSAALAGLVATAALDQRGMASIAALVSDIGSNGVGEYLGLSIAFFLLFWLGLHQWLRSRQLSRRRWPRLRQISRELLFGVSAQFVMLGVGAWTSVEFASVEANRYAEIGDYGWLYLAFVTFVLFAADDTVFYWTHRAMHHQRLFDAFHRVHHESTDPTPFTSFSFHPLEAVVQSIGSLVLVPVMMLLPWHPLALLIYSIGSISFNLIGHLGYEVYPRGWTRLPVLRWKTTALHHYQHHQMVGGNYALYFRWWDRWCGTEFRDFEARFDRVTGKDRLVRLLDSGGPRAPAQPHSNG